MEHPFRYVLDNTYFLLTFIKEKKIEEQTFGGLKRKGIYCSYWHLH